MFKANGANCSNNALPTTKKTPGVFKDSNHLNFIFTMAVTRV